MKLLKPAGCLFPSGRGNVKELTMIVEGQGSGFRTRVQIPSGPSDFARILRAFFMSFFTFCLLCLFSYPYLLLYQPVVGINTLAFLPRRARYAAPSSERGCRGEKFTFGDFICRFLCVINNPVSYDIIVTVCLIRCAHQNKTTPICQPDAAEQIERINSKRRIKP